MEIVYVNGQGDFSAMDMEDSGELKQLVSQMVKDGITSTESEDESTVSIIEVGEVDKRFINFVRNNIVDYDLAKMSEFYLLNEILVGGN